MAFPVSPVDGQVYNNYIYDAAKETWEFNNIDLQNDLVVSGLRVVNGGAAGSISLEDGKHHITNNDGGGNFVIRVGNKYDGGPVCTENGYAGLIEYNQTDGWWQISTSSSSLTAGDSVDWGNSITMNQYGVGFLTSPYTSTSYRTTIGSSVHMNNHAINYASQFHCQNNGQGDIHFGTVQGLLPGYASDYYPVLKTDWSYLYFSVGGAYSAYMSASGTLTAKSSRTVKHNFVDITYEDYFDKMSRIEVQQYEYNEDFNDGRIYIGPYAEDIKAEFDLGSGKMMSDKDTAGVALLGVKHLLNQISELEALVEQLEIEKGLI